MQEIKGSYVRFKLTTEQLNEINRIAKKRSMTKSNVFRMMVDAGLHAHKDLERLGLIKVFDLVSWVRESSKNEAKGYEPHQLNLPL